MIFQQILNGLVTGSVYALFALGFTLIFGVLHILNLAHGAIFMAGAFVGLYTVTAANLSLPVALIFAMLAGGLISVAVDWLALRPLRRRGSNEFAAIIASLGVAQILMCAGQAVSQTQIMRFPFGTFPVVIYQFWGLRISLLQIVIIGLSLVLAVGLLTFLFRSSYGRQIRAVAISERTSSLLGIRPSTIYFQTFFISGALAGAAGVIIGLAFNSVHFLMGEPYLLNAFVVIVLGGLGSIGGALIGGILFGIVKTLTIIYLSSVLGDAIIYGVLLLVLLFRPSGLFGKLHIETRVVRT